MHEIKPYELVWMSKYSAAKEYIETKYPEKLVDFITRFNVLRTNPDFKIKELSGLLNQTELDLIRKTINSIPTNKMNSKEIKRYGRFILSDHPTFLKLQSDLTDKVSELVGEEVEPCYNFLSLYTCFGICEPHMDAPSIKWTLDICVDQSEPWMIHFSQVVPWEHSLELGEDWQQAIKSNPSLKFETKVIEPGDAILFSGSCWHYRDAFPQTNNHGFCNLLFFHYIPKGSSELIKPKNWASLFNIPELADVVGN